MEPKDEIYKTVLVIVTGLLTLYLIFDIPYLDYFAAGIGIVCLISFQAGKFLEKAWYKVAALLGWVNTRILLTTIYFLILTPAALFYRLFKKDPLGLKKEGMDSYLVIRNHAYKKEDFINVW